MPILHCVDDVSHRPKARGNVVNPRMGKNNTSMNINVKSGKKDFNLSSKNVCVVMTMKNV